MPSGDGKYNRPSEMGDMISSLLFQPPPPTKLKENKIIWLTTTRGCRIPAFYIECPRATGVGTDGGPQSRSATELANGGGYSGGVTFLYSHANAEDLGNIYPWCKFLSKMLRVNVLAYDYTGYGLAHDQGEPSEENCYADIDAAYSYLKNTLRIPPRNIVLYGRSLGSGPSCYLASKTADEAESNRDALVGGVILHAPFLSVYRIVIESGCTLVGDKFPNVDFAPTIRSPVLLVHGTKDKIVPFDHSERLLRVIPEKYRAKPLFVHGMGHNNVHAMVRPLFVERMGEYLDERVRPNSVPTLAASFRRDGAIARLVKRRVPKQSSKRGGLDTVPSEEVSDKEEGRRQSRRGFRQ